MGKYFRILIFGLLFNINAFSQNYEDVVVLKDGSEIYGVIIENKPNQYIKIKSGKNTFVYNYYEIEVLRKEIKDDSSNDKKTSSIINKNKSIGLGFGTNKTFNILQYTYDLKLSKNFSIYSLLGFGNLYGLGIAWQQNYNENGLMVGWSGGIDIDESAFGSFSVSYQWRLKESSTFLSLGISSYAYEQYTYNYFYGGYYEMVQVFVPIISIDNRF